MGDYLVLLKHHCTSEVTTADFFFFPPYTGSDSYWDELLLTFSYLSVGEKRKQNSLSLE